MIGSSLFIAVILPPVFPDFFAGVISPAVVKIRELEVRLKHIKAEFHQPQQRVVFTLLTTADPLRSIALNLRNSTEFQQNVLDINIL
jgi:hypothetical protein